MLNRSMANYMNALTAHDYTMYPFSTLSLTDYTNLLNVYLDSCFNPLLSSKDFSQEGWRLEHKDTLDKNSDIVFKGVVYNEMKGALSDVNSLFYTNFHQQLFPNTNYVHSSGGDPTQITNVTHHELVKFHSEKYIPKNSLIYIYSNQDNINSKLDILDKYLTKFGNDSTIPDNPAINPDYKTYFDSIPNTKSVVSYGPPDTISSSLDSQIRTSLTYYTCSNNDLMESLYLRVITSLLIDGQGSPMYKALLDSHLGSEYSVNSGFDDSTFISTVSIGLQGVKESNISTVAETIKKTLEYVFENGFSPSRVENVIHQIELGLKHRTANFGINIGMNLSSNWAKGNDLLEVLDIPKYLEKLRQVAKIPNFFESKLQQYFLKDPKIFSFTMIPDANFSEKLSKEEESRLKQKISTLTEKDKENIYNRGVELLSIQNEKQDISILPTLSISEIEQIGKIYPTTETKVLDIPVTFRSTSTNGISYINIAFNVDEIPSELKVYVPLFCTALTSLETKERSVQDLDDLIRKRTGGISASVSACSDTLSLDQKFENIYITSNSLDMNISEMYSILSEVLTTTNWSDIHNLKTIISSSATDMMSSIAQSGHSFAMLSSASHLSHSQKINEIYGGITQVQFMGAQSKLINDELLTISSKLQQISNYLIRSKMRVMVNCDSGVETTHQKKLEGLIESIPFDNSSISKSIFSPYQPLSESLKTFYEVPFAVNYTGKSFRGVPYTHKDGPSLQILSHLMTNHFLHREIREKGGAYGGRASYNPISGMFQMMSYRDPEIQRTLDTYDKVTKWATEIQNNIGKNDLDEAKLNIFQKLDVPLNASSEGTSVFMKGPSNELKQLRRQRILDVSIDDILQLSGKYLINSPNSTSVIGSMKNIQDQSSWNVIKLGDTN